MAADTEANRAYGIAAPGYRLPDATRIGRVRLQVADLQRSLDYDERVLGLVACPCQMCSGFRGAAPGSKGAKSGLIGHT